MNTIEELALENLNRIYGFMYDDKINQLYLIDDFTKDSSNYNKKSYFSMNNKYLLQYKQLKKFRILKDLVSGIEFYIDYLIIDELFR